ncbi:MFS transporter [Streptomyces sp. NPDC091266]|uniref:MFS transporter n=1 Tax=Streptomyces sp. NPDC091266 TaxID=3365978 RepID=UPI003825CE10
MDVGTRNPPSTAEPYRWRWAALAVVLIAEIMDLLDSTIVGVAAPAVRSDLGGGSSALQWLAAAYTLAFAVGLITGGRLGDLFGRRRMLLIGLFGFTLSSALCGMADSIGALIAVRALQGLFAALTIPQSYSIVVAVFSPQERGKAFGAFGPVMALASVGGPVLAGALINADIAGSHWRSIFFINVPLGVLAFLGTLRYVPESRAEVRPRLDLVGMALVSAATVLLIYPLVQGRELGWPAWTFVCMVAAVPVLALFWWWEKRVSRAGGSPLVVVGLLSKRAFSGSLVVGILFFAAMNGLLLVFALFLQVGLGWSPMRAGLEIAPIAFGVALGAIAAGAVLVPRFGRRVLHAGAAVMAVGAGGVSLTLHGAGADVGGWQLSPALLVTGVGMGLFLSPFFDFALASVEEEETGSASGVLNATQQLGATVGVAVLGTLFFALVGGQVAAAGDMTQPQLRDRVVAAGARPADAASLAADVNACTRARAEATDSDATPASCRRLAEDATTTAASAAQPAGVRAAVQDAAGTVRATAFAKIMERVLWSIVAILALVAAAVFLLPRAPREEDPHAEPNVPPEGAGPPGEEAQEHGVQEQQAGSLSSPSVRN